MVIKETIKTQQRDRMKNLGVKAGSSGYGLTMETVGVRFSGRAGHSGDRQLMSEAKATEEPDWMRLSPEQLVAAEKMALHRISGGEASWKGVLERIRGAMVAQTKQQHKKRKKNV